MNDFITNGTEIKQRIISEINNAKQCIYVAMAYFTDREIAMAIVEAKNRNINVDIILSSNLQNDTVKLMLKGANISVHAFETGDARGIMHHKFCLIDNRISINGSYNYSLNASNNNVENITVSDDLTTYTQMLSEFERLKYNIDNRIAVNEPTQRTEQKIAEVQPLNIIDTFSKRLHDLVYSAAQIDTEKYRQQGYENSRESHGNLDIFRVEYENIKERIRTYATDEGLGNMKNVLSSNVTIAYESTKANLETEKQEKLSIEKRNGELENRQVNEKIDDLKQEKSILETGNQNSGEIGLFQINIKIEKNKLERRTLEQSFLVNRFWTLGNIFVLIGLAIFAFYLSIFFASAIYKVFFEGNVIRESLEAGINPGIPQLVDANAIIKIFRQQGVLFGIIASLFFLIPILLSNIKILGSKNKVINFILFLVGLLIFDILVSYMVAMNTDEIKSLLVAKKSTLQFWDVVKLGEFWLIFVFGMFPLILTHFLIENITNAFKNSQKDLVDAEKNKKIQLLEEEMIELNSEKEKIANKLKEIEEAINLQKGKILQIESEMNNHQTQIEIRYSEWKNQLKAIYDDYSARILSGKIFTDVIFDSVISAYKSGFIEFLPEYYATEEVAFRVKEIDRASEIAIL
ncbi:phospholipase D-like domain-containing protein [Pedobacter flavus]|uniref:phospholipase D n=1 Tax=Pedobacter flavus TaxID=3113906 RepID=A0ABU7H2R3_9SPHI|nr:phospholipase D-like domain-containing protein [Pedobacter sp. VNH31]MEE1885308.1 phospholipase D-like domain-containing protein [Pedobacter sp. VNH31]